jgi:hypothetical protein
VADDQDRAELTDDDKLGGEFPPERPLGAHRRQDDAIPESFASREARTNPEVEDADRPTDAGVPFDEEAPLDGQQPVTADDDTPSVPEAAEEAALRLRETPG